MWQPDNEIKQVERSQPFIDGLSGPVVIPLLQSFVTAMITGAFAACVVAVFRVDVSGWGVFGLVTTGTMLITWLSYRGRWMKIIESYIGVDLDGDNVIGQPEPEPVRDVKPIRVDLVRENGADWLQLPYADRLPALAASVLPTRQFSQTMFVGSGRLFSRGEYDSLCRKLIEAGLAEWRNDNHHNAGLQLSHAGAAVFRRLVDRSPTSPEDAEP